MKRILKSKLDKFYTKEKLAKKLISNLDLSEYDLLIDPSCGDGSFFNNLNHSNKIGIDIQPEIENVITHDYLTWEYKENIPSYKVLIITNPPFGKQGSLALNFIKKSAEISDTIAFILPLSFMKDSMKNKIPEYFHLEYEEKLEPDSFILDNKDYDIKCVFQIWKKKDYKRIKTKIPKEINFKYTKNKNEADLSIRRVGIYAGKCFKEIDKSEQSHYFIILNNKNKINTVFNSLNNKVWEDFTVGPRSISKIELTPFINEILK